MGERIYLCHQCQNIFKSGDASPGAATCPRCGGSQTEILPSWVPDGSGLNDGSPMWEYECQQCKHVFKRPVPDSPSQEKNMKCPECGHGHIHRLTAIGGEPLYCG